MKILYLEVTKWEQWDIWIRRNKEFYIHVR